MKHWLRRLRRLFRCRHRHRPRLKVHFGEGMTNVSLKTNQTVVARVQKKDDAGNIIAPVGPFTRSVSDGNIATVAPSADTLSALVTPRAAGSVTITTTGDGLTGTGDVSISQLVVTLEVIFDAPTP